MPISAYLRALSRLCREAAEQAENDLRRDRRAEAEIPFTGNRPTAFAENGYAPRSAGASAEQDHQQQEAPSVRVPAMNQSQLQKWVKDALDGIHVIGSVAEIIDIFHTSTAWPAIEAALSWGDAALATGASTAGALALAIEIAVPLGYVATMAITVFELYEAFSTGTRIQTKKGYCYGIMWEALNMKPVDRTFQPWGVDTAEELLKAWNEGVEKGRAVFKSDIKLHNEVLLRIAYERLTQNKHGWTEPEGRVFNLLWEQVRGDDLPGIHLGWMVFSNLGAEYDEKLDADEIVGANHPPSPPPPASPSPRASSPQLLPPSPLFPSTAPLTNEETGIIGQTDDRLHVDDTTAIPFRWVCSVAVQRLVRKPSHDEKTGLAPAGSGVLISPQHVLTAAHLLHDAERNEDGSIAVEYEALLVHVAPGRSGSSEPFGEIEAKSWAVHPKWDPKAPLARYDYALITLDNKIGDQKFRSFNDQPLYFWGSDKGGGGTLIDNLPSTLSKRLIGMKIVTAGYPQSKQHEMWCAAGEFSTGSAQVDAQLTQHGQVENWVAMNPVFKITADATRGQSGSPVWVVDDGQRYLIGIIEAAGETYNTVIAVNADVVSQLRSWIGADGASLQAREVLEEPDFAGESEEAVWPSKRLYYARQARPGNRPAAPMLEWDVPPAAAVSVGVDPFPSLLPLTLDRSNATMNARMAAVASDPALSTLCAALVDLTGNPAHPPYAGFNDQDMVFVGSLQKISAAYAAFELRARVRAEVAAAIAGGLSTATAGWEKPVIHALQIAWQPKLTAAFPGLPKGFPDIGKMFTFSTAGVVDFAAAPLTDSQIEDVGEFGRVDLAKPGHWPAGKYHDAMRSMLRWSNDASASFCIRPLSFPYINGALAGAGFFDSAHQTGLWLSADYERHDWIPNPRGNPQANRAGRPLSAHWQKAQGRKLSNVTATAFQVARLLTLLATDKLLSDPTANQEMRRPMTRPPLGGTVSFIADALQRDGRSLTSIVSKIGIGDDNSGHDCAIVDRTVSGKALRYAVVGLGDMTPTNAGLNRLFPLLDDIILALHP
ncbi:MAG TPA: trypsin-like peptidase domain-containing protein [Stellaceae bacterium]|nr:trypsin-like peptidase domain-containing protein [Stellaceae bacterium]